MEMFRFILIIAGVAILALLYFSGRPKRNQGQYEALDSGRGERIPLADDQYPQADNYNDIADNGAYPQADAGYQHVNSSQTIDPLLEDPNAQFGDMAQMDPDDFVRPGTGELQAEVAELETQPASSLGRSSIAQKIKEYSSALTPGRKQRISQSGTQQRTATGADAATQSKIVSVHVVAPQGQVFNGADLYELFEQRGFHYGEMNIFHSMHSQKKMFSIAKMVEPGYFDINDIESFYTPGITLILQLPGPVAADVSFEVLISEARLLAQHLGGVVLGSDRSTLSNQTVAHMREDIVNYMHRQKFFAAASS